MAMPFDHLLEGKWRSTPFPILKMRVSIAHDLAEHKYWGVDAARMEDTGLTPMRFSFSIPMHQGIYPAKTESWKAASLYPTLYRQLLVDFAKKTTGVLQHPEFGDISCKAEKLDIDYDGSRRGGVEIEATWVETINDGDVKLQPPPQPVNQLAAAADDLDASNADLTKLVPAAPQFKTTFGDLVHAVQGVFDQATLIQTQTGGQVDAIVYRVNALAASVDAARTAATWPITQNIERMRSAANNLRQKLLQTNRDIILYIVPQDTALAALAKTLPEVEVADLVALNPILVRGPLVPRYTVIRYYAPKKGN